MVKILATHEVANLEKWKTFNSERRENLGAFADEISEYVDPNGGNIVAVAMTVHDPDGLEAFLQSAACAAIMERHGVIQPLTILAGSN